ncbi:MAG: 3-ketoacyl-ACP reductase [Planctomycetaceae bacterium]|nr:3-ketoacyl-ACP reductase [Planctomycetaceae bacterium]
MPATDSPVALITGSSRGIGAAIARTLGESGYRVVINYLQNEHAGNAILDELTDAGHSAITCRADICDSGDRQRLLDKTLAAYGRLDLLVNNAGITSQGRLDLLDATEDSWDLVFDTNLKGPFFLSQLAARQMLNQNDRYPRVIININSISAYAISHNRADYCIAKAGLELMTKIFASRLAEDQILVYEICPGVIESDMTAPVKDKYDELIKNGLTPIKRWGTCEDVATAVQILASGKLNFTTGERLNVDGGYHIRRL